MSWPDDFLAQCGLPDLADAAGKAKYDVFKKSANAPFGVLLMLNHYRKTTFLYPILSNANTQT
jgi:hypothetical protein